MKPPYSITSNMLHYCTEIMRAVGQLEGLKLSSSPILSRKRRIRTIHSSLAIEGNRLSPEQVTAIIENKQVIGPSKDILEVKNAINAYEALPKYKVFTLSSLLNAHKILMTGLTQDAGLLRRSDVGIFEGSKVKHMAPKHVIVPELMDNLFKYMKINDDTHLLIKSCIFHYEIEFIHPFTDGNGRIGRLWQSASLMQLNPLFEFLPVESLIHKNQNQYYKALETSDKDGNSNAFIHFMLKTIHQTIQAYLKDARAPKANFESRIMSAKTHFNKKAFNRKSYIDYIKTISTATASRDLARAVKDGLLKTEGDKSQATYHFF